jgi:iron complex transport system ATP-binding protein
MEASLNCKDLSIGYHTKGNTKIVCKNLNANLEIGKLTSLIGVNGAGKSTLLRTLSGFIKPIRGNVIIGNQALNKMSYEERSKTIGVVLTERTDIQQFTVREMVALGRSPYTGFFDKLSALDNKIIDDAIKMVGIRDLEYRMVDTLSDGERQKVMIAKVLAQQTPLILLDEPTAFLDYPSKVEVLTLLHQLAHDMKKSILLSTHDLGTAIPIADQIWLMNNNGQLDTGNRQHFGLEMPITSEQIMKMFGTIEQIE